MSQIPTRIKRLFIITLRSMIHGRRAIKTAKHPLSGETNLIRTWWQPWRLKKGEGKKKKNSRRSGKQWKSNNELKHYDQPTGMPQHYRLNQSRTTTRNRLPSCGRTARYEATPGDKYRNEECCSPVFVSKRINMRSSREQAINLKREMDNKRGSSRCRSIGSLSIRRFPPTFN